MSTLEPESAPPGCCPACRTPLKPGAAEGLCARCLLGSALELAAIEPETPDDDAMVGTLLAGRIIGQYELLGTIARGGMGTVFKARQRQPDRQVALKVISAGELATRAMVERFHNEALAAARLSHPHIVPIFEVGQDQGWHFFSMQLVEGRTLADLIRQGPADPVTAVHLLVKIARAVEHAHQRGILHRDLKPTNILLDTHGEPHLTDFGLAKVLERQSDLTLTHAVLGTPAYMSPEQAGGRNREITTATDVYGLGAVFYELLDGRPPFEGESAPALLRRIVEEDPRPLRSRRPRSRDDRPSATPGTSAPVGQSSRSLPRDLEIICLKCLEKDPARRYATAGDLADELERWLRNEPIRARRAGAWERGVKWVRRHPARAGLAATVILSGFVLTVVSLAFNVRLDRARKTAEANARQARTQLVAEHLRDAGKRTAAGDALTALFPLVEALRLEDPARTRAIRERIDLTLRFSPELLRLWDAGGAPVELRFTPDHRHLIAVLRRGGVRIWDLLSGRLVHTSTPDPQPPTGVQIAPDGSRILELFDGPPHARIRSVPDGAIRPLPLDRPAGAAGAFSPDGRMVVTGGPTLQFWDAGSLVALPRRLDIPDPCERLRFSPDGRFLVTVHSGGQPRLWDWVHGTPLPLETVPGPPVRSAIEFSRDGEYLLTAGPEEIHLFQPDTGRHLYSAPHSGMLFQLAFDPAGRYFGAASFRDQARIWSWTQSATRPEPAIHPFRRPLAHESGANQIRFSPDGRWLATAGFDYQVRLVESTRHQMAAPILHHTALVEALNFSGDARFLATGDANGLVRVWDLQPRGLRFIPLVTAKPTPRFSPDGRFFIARERTDRLVVVETATGRVEDRPLFAPTPLPAPDKLTGPAAENWRDAAVRGAPNDIAFDPTGRHLAVALGTNGVVVWDFATRTRLRSIPLADPVLSVAFSPDGQVLAAGTRSSGVHRLRWQDSSRPAPAPLRWSFPAETVDWSRDGRWIAAGATRAVQVWDATTGAPVGDTLPVDDLLTVAGFPPAGDRLLVAAGNDKIEPASARLFDLPSLRSSTPGMAHGDGVAAAAFSPDGRFLATGGEDNTVRLWHASDGSMAAPVMRHSAIVNTLSFAPDGRILAAAGNDGYARLWQVPGGELSGPPLPLGRSVPSIVFAPDGRSVLAATHTEGTWLFDLQPDGHAVADLERLAQGQTALHVGAAGAIGQAPVARLAALFASPREENRFTDPEARRAWHERVAVQAESVGDRFAAAFHLRRLLSLRPDDSAVAQRLRRVTGADH